jgi:hypothetical protein
MTMKTVKATREGLTNAITASGYRIDDHVPFLALPSKRALGMFVRLRNPANNKTALAVVLDVGPWNEHDDGYVFGPNQPQAESGKDTWGRRTNRAGIDLGAKLWDQLGMLDNTDVQWEFVE